MTARDTKMGSRATKYPECFKVSLFHLILEQFESKNNGSSLKSNKQTTYIYLAYRSSYPLTFAFSEDFHNKKTTSYISTWVTQSKLKGYLSALNFGASIQFKVNRFDAGNFS